MTWAWPTGDVVKIIIPIILLALALSASAEYNYTSHWEVKDGSFSSRFHTSEVGVGASNTGAMTVDLSGYLSKGGDGASVQMDGAGRLGRFWGMSQSGGFSNSLNVHSADSINGKIEATSGGESPSLVYDLPSVAGFASFRADGTNERGHKKSIVAEDAYGLFSGRGSSFRIGEPVDVGPIAEVYETVDLLNDTAPISSVGEPSGEAIVLGANTSIDNVLNPLGENSTTLNTTNQTAVAEALADDYPALWAAIQEP